MSKKTRGLIEALLFASGEPLSLDKLCELTGLTQLEVHQIVTELASNLEEEERGYRVQQVAGGFFLTTPPEYAAYIEKLRPKAPPLSNAALETLAIIAYRQPVTRAEIEAIRGVKVDRALSTLTERRLIKEVGRKEGLGRPILYGVTDEFLKYFGLYSLKDLPPIYQD